MSADEPAILAVEKGEADRAQGGFALSGPVNDVDAGSVTRDGCPLCAATHGAPLSLPDPLVEAIEVVVERFLIRLGTQRVLRSSHATIVPQTSTERV